MTWFEWRNLQNHTKFVGKSNSHEWDSAWARLKRYIVYKLGSHLHSQDFSGSWDEAWSRWAPSLQTGSSEFPEICWFWNRLIMILWTFEKAMRWAFGCWKAWLFHAKNGNKRSLRPQLLPRCDVRLQKESGPQDSEFLVGSFLTRISWSSHAFLGKRSEIATSPTQFLGKLPNVHHLDETLFGSMRDARKFGWYKWGKLLQDSILLLVHLKGLVFHRLQLKYFEHLCRNEVMVTFGSSHGWAQNPSHGVQVAVQGDIAEMHGVLFKSGEMYRNVVPKTSFRKSFCCKNRTFNFLLFFLAQQEAPLFPTLKHL